MTVVLIILVYLTAGATILAILNAIQNGRVERNIASGVITVRGILLDKRVPASEGFARFVTWGATWVFWPAYCVGAVQNQIDIHREKQKQDKEADN